MTTSEIEERHTTGDAIKHSYGTSSKTDHRTGVEFWYSRRQALMIVLVLFVVVRSYSVLTPPFQSPDEFNHIKRAYLLSQGVFLATITETVVGGEIDTGLMTYMKCFGHIPFNYGNKIDRATERECNVIQFTGRTTFSSFPNTASYFPLLYSPQALALLIGRIGGLTVSTSYYLARLFSQLASLSLILFSMIIFPLPPAVLALFLMPMSLFQLASASLDAMSFSAAVATSALFMRAYDRRLPFNSGMRLFLSICILLLSLARIIYIAFAPLLLALYYRMRSKSYILYFILIACTWIFWMLYVKNAILGAQPVDAHAQHIGGAWTYASYIWLFCVDLFKALTNFELVKGYLQAFVGVLGASDTPLSTFAYAIFCVGILTIIALSTEVDFKRVMDRGNLMLWLTALMSLVFLFLVFEDWTVSAGGFVAIQGRYFYPTAIFFVYSLWGRYLSRTRARACVAVIALLALSSIELAMPALLDRYWTSEFAEAHF